MLAAWPRPEGGRAVGAHEDAAPGAVVDDVVAARCPGCGYTYEVEAGEEREGFAAGTAWSEVPDDWSCPDCGVRDKVDFVPLTSAAGAAGAAGAVA